MRFVFGWVLVLVGGREGVIHLNEELKYVRVHIWQNCSNARTTGPNGTIFGQE